MNIRFVRMRWWLVLIACAWIGAGHGVGRNFPLKVNPDNPRQLVDQQNVPFLIHGDSAWALINMLTEAEAEQYLTARQQQGFNTVMVMLIACDKDINGHQSVNAYGQEPFIPDSNFGAPNEAYFAHADWVIDRAAQKGMQVLLAPCYIGYDSSEGWQDIMVANGTNGCRAYGRFLGERYKNRPNLMWLHSGDNGDLAYMPYLREMALGIKEADTNHLHTVKLWPEESSRDKYLNESWLDFNATYVYGTMPEWDWDIQVPEKSLADYNATPPLPSFLIEANYELEHNAVPQWIRRQAYWSILSGSTGQLMGNGLIWPFLAGWQDELQSTGAGDMARLKKFFGTRPWFKMVPDQKHAAITSGYGTLGTTDYLTAMRATNGSTVIGYLPTGRTIKANLKQIAGTQARAWWFNPRTGAATNLGTFATTTTNSFAAPDTNDWVFVLDDVAAGYAAPGSGVSLLEVLTGSIPGGRVGSPYLTELLAFGGVPPYSWSLAADSVVSCGLTLSTNGIFGGTPEVSGSFNFVVQVTDANLVTATQRLTLNLAALDIEAPSMPVALTAFSSSSQQIDLSWGASTDNVAVVAYNVERRGGTHACFDFVTSTTGLSFRDAGLAGGTSYQYRVRAVDSSGNQSAYSGLVEARTRPSKVVPAGLVAAYGFEERAGLCTYDAADNANVGYITGAVWTASGKYGSALAFNGSNSVVFVAPSASLNISTGMTLEAWVYPTTNQAGWRAIVQRQTDAYLLHAGSSVAALRPAGGGTFDGNVAWTNCSSTLPLNAWTHLAVTYDGALLRLYFNGTQSSSKAVTGCIQTNANPLRMGGNAPYGEYFIGRIDDVRVYNRSLSAAEVLSDMNTPAGPAETNTPPTISGLANQVIDGNTVGGPMAFTISDGETAPNDLCLKAVSSNPALIPSENILFSGSGTNRSMMITPSMGQSGTASILVGVSDGQFTSGTYFDITVAPVAPPVQTNDIVITAAEVVAGHFHLTGTGDAHVSYVVQASTDLVNWSDLGEAVADEHRAFDFGDAEAGDYAVRFYRVVRRF